MDLFSSYRLGRLDLPNRLVMAPMTRCRAIGGVPNELMSHYYAQRASAGLIITEGVAPSPNGLGYARIPGLFSAAQIAGWRLVTDAVHAAGGRILAQLMHVGRVAHVLNLPAGARSLAPSAVTASGNMWTDQSGLQPFSPPEAMTPGEVKETRLEFVQAAQNAMSAGFDGVELHAANGYLLEQFLNPHTNRREDAYGGSIENRIRFLAETAQATAEAIGAERVGVRLSPYSTFNDLPGHDDVAATYQVLARALAGLLYLHLLQNPHAEFETTFATVRQSFAGPIILNGGMDRARAEARLGRHEADLISFGRPFIANPDLVRRLKDGAPLATPNAQTFYTPGREGYLDYTPLEGA